MILDHRPSIATGPNWGQSTIDGTGGHSWPTKYAVRRARNRASVRNWLGAEWWSSFSILWSRRSPDSHIWDGGWHGDLIVHRTRDAVSGDDVRFQVGMAWPGEIINLRNSAIVFLVEEDAAARSFGSRNLRCARSPENFSESQAASSLEPLSGAEA